MLRNGVGGIGRHTENMDFSEAGPGIHIVETGAAQGNHPHATGIKLFHNGCVGHIIYENAHAVKTVGQRCGILVKLGFQKLDFDAGILSVLGKTRDIVGLGIKKRNFH